MALLKRRSARFHFVAALIAAAIAAFVYVSVGRGTLTYNLASFSGEESASQAQTPDYRSQLQEVIAKAGRALDSLLHIQRIVSDLPDDVVLGGSARSPDEVYENSSFNVSVNLDQEMRRQLTPAPDGVVANPLHDSSNVKIGIGDPASKDVIEAELLAPGMMVAGDPKQRVALSLGTFNYYWLCRVGSDEDYTMTFEFRLIRPGVDPINLGRFSRDVKVNSLFHVPKWVLVGAGFIAGIGAFVQTAIALYTWWKKGTVSPSEAAPS